MTEDTIAALSTPPGEGGIAVIRVSGPDSQNKVKQIFRSSRTDGNFNNKKMYHGQIVSPETNRILDEVLVVFMNKPYTYTCEDVVEIHCHGGMVPVKEILQLLFSYGIRPAEPGEFTKRAFLNGRLDLTQAEGVMDLITSKTNNLKNVAINQLQGNLKQKIDRLRDDLVSVMANLEARIDFPDEDIDVEDYHELKHRIDNAKVDINNLIASYDKGKIIREGIKTVIVGRPNVGKSSLLNLLLGEERAIVTEIPGTTRDVLEEVINLKGIPLRIIDTAGIRESEDKVEQIGVKRTRDSMEQADIILVVIDSSQELSQEDKQILTMAQDKTSLLVLNKTDLHEKLDIDEIDKLVSQIPKVRISALKEEGLDKLEEHISELVFGGQVMQTEELVITKARHFHSLDKVKEALSSAEENIKAEMSEDLIAIDIKEAYDYLGEITGETASEELVDRIFNDFCIGK
ncbi:tRNA uridine-5-carboxymethylaminomethyl(34) synthesis GTPase MnmE [Natranaerobius thermophilus]|uniref:tRNA modification GTPase MnmE n=1 Tax=Natranaerobius thermophilus (strain ATCC BAA-1301 / DSM 18059 / JW/NM-WN-LF) TaxID=457570 RepID=MNME_NATTJ|nr:tRNA uridine-5-carboxymethylaminomethyl(34) synthesis GTPase MnmE [Natranaerobius thermophilus]B2A470.1 RecName: Full=tRNA modification GTPase MnmE [Natranaerobius thermophilus JW/NM-WN-LF]ACB86476.1 tRNA modification GTPase TrmE [Natranaerobius thermophilus JW/NM-WN-LF]